MKIFKTCVLALAAVMAFSACSKENDGKPTENEKVRFQVKISTPEVVESRAIGDNSVGTPLTLVGGKIIFSNSVGTITKVIKIVANSATPAADEIKVADLAAGADIDDVDAGTTVVTFIGAHAADVNPLPADLTTKTLADVKKAAFNVATIADGSSAKVSNVPIYGYDDALTTTGSGNNTVIEADFQVKAIGSRIQISGIKGGTNVKSFTVGGIWINNYIPSKAYDVATDAATIVNNGNDVANYVAGYAVPALCDVEATANAGIGTKTADNNWTAGAGKFFAYNVFPNLAPLTEAHLPHIVIRLDNLTDTGDTNHGTKYLTVKGYTGATIGTITNFAPGYSYTFGGADGLAFDLDKVTDKPEQGKVKGKVTVEALAWKDELVTPEF